MKNIEPKEKQDVKIVRVKIKAPTRDILLILSGGRCQFKGCNKFLFEHHLTKEKGNFGQMAHIVAYNNGARKIELSDAYINDHSNLMLLCPDDHKLVDDNPEEYPIELLKKYKETHENRIRQLTEIKDDRKTKVLVLKSIIGTQLVEVNETHIRKAIAPRFPSEHKFQTIDLTKNSIEDSTFYKNSQNYIKNQVALFISNGLNSEESGHISLFGLAPIPLLAFLGNEIGNKIPVDAFQRHRDTEDWTWKENEVPIEYKSMLIQKGTHISKVALLISLSGKISTSLLPKTINNEFSIYELTIENPDFNFLKTKEDLQLFKRVYRKLLDEIKSESKNLKEIHLFPACPAPIGFHCGRELMPKIDPKILVYDFNKTRTGFYKTLTIN